tara:strand:+ start:217 stop:450 length:234 start_codon:yes stop_codon:yes gene_type:complete
MITDFKAYQREYYIKNKDKHKAYRDNYYQNNREKFVGKVNCDVCGKCVCKSNLAKHKKSHLCVPKKEKEEGIVIHFD